jgi:hypothetical protein
VALFVVASGCEDSAAKLQVEVRDFLNGWYDQAAAGARDEALCHGLGLLKHPEFTCTDMLEHASHIDRNTSSLPSITPLDCFAGVCGELYEVALTSRDRSGNEISETHVLKRDEGMLRVYWYRSDTMMAALRAANPDQDEQAKDPLQTAYDEVVARYPGLYEFTPCYGVRASSSNLVGALMAKDAVDTEEVMRLAQSCGDNFCFGLVGDKIAPLCPR